MEERVYTLVTISKNVERAKKNFLDKEPSDILLSRGNEVQASKYFDY